MYRFHHPQTVLVVAAATGHAVGEVGALQLAAHRTVAGRTALLLKSAGDKNLAQKLKQEGRLSLDMLQRFGEELIEAVNHLEAEGVAHRDIKPDNLHVDAEGRLRILDLGVAAADSQHDGQAFEEINNPGTPSYMAPELHAARPVPASEQTDLYAVGVTLYQLLTRKYPYGEIEPFQTPKFGDPVPPTRYRPDIPAWLESVLLKAVARDPKARFETAEEFLLALERGAHRPLVVPPQVAAAGARPAARPEDPHRRVAGRQSADALAAAV